MKNLITLCLSLFFSLTTLSSHAQNIIGYKIQIAADAPAFIEFPSEVDNARWDNNEMNNFYKFFTPNANVLQITYNGTPTPPGSGNGFSVVQGKNTHIFYLEFIDKYDINRDPTLYYNFSDKSKLRAAAELAKKQKSISEGTVVVSNEEKKKIEDEEKALAVLKQKDADEKKAEMALAQKARQKEIAEQNKAASEKAKADEAIRQAEIAKAKKEADRIALEEKKAKEQELEIAKANAAEEKKKRDEEEKKRKENEEQERILAQERKKQEEKDRIAVQQAKADAEKRKLAAEKEERAAAERKRIAEKEEKERLELAAAQKAAEERDRKAEEARKIAEAKQRDKEEADAKLLALKQEQEAAKKASEYDELGLWNKYGKKGINLYEIPAEQFNYNSADFYIEEDTLINARYSQTVLQEVDRIDLKSDTKNGVTVSLKGISFDGPYAYYKIEVDNQSKDDFLVGANVISWYLEDGSPKNYLKCSYLTSIGFFPLVKPNAKQNYVYVCRAANINEEDKLVLSIQERRNDKPKYDVVFTGADYLSEFGKIAKSIKSVNIETTTTEGQTEKPEKKNKKKNK